MNVQFSVRVDYPVAVTDSAEMLRNLSSPSAFVAVRLDLGDESWRDLMLDESDSSTSARATIDDVACISRSRSVAFVADLFPRYVELS